MDTTEKDNKIKVLVDILHEFVVYFKNIPDLNRDQESVIAMAENELDTYPDEQ